MLMARCNMTDDEAVEAAIPFIHDPATPRARIDEDLAVRRPWCASPQGYMAQLRGILAWEAYDGLAPIQAPTLIIHGQIDRLIPPRNAELIASPISGAYYFRRPATSFSLICRKQRDERFWIFSRRRTTPERRNE